MNFVYKLWLYSYNYEEGVQLILAGKGNLSVTPDSGAAEEVAAVMQHIKLKMVLKYQLVTSQICYLFIYFSATLPSKFHLLPLSFSHLPNDICPLVIINPDNDTPGYDATSLDTEVCPT